MRAHLVDFTQSLTSSDMQDDQGLFVFKIAILSSRTKKPRGQARGLGRTKGINLHERETRYLV